MLKNCKLIMLPTNEKAQIGDFIIVKYNNNTLITPGKIECGIKKYEGDGVADQQHLYILSDDEIKVGDWLLTASEHQEPFKVENDLHADNIRVTNKHVVATPFRKIIASTNPSLNLPSPSQAFIEKYCEVGGIDEVLVQYEVTPISDYATLKLGVFMDNRFWTLGDPALIPNSFWLKSNDGTTENTSGSGYILGEDIEVKPKTKNNQITIKPIKNNFTRLEMIAILDKFQVAKLSLEDFVEKYM